jgi:hypothetical protein
MAHFSVYFDFMRYLRHDGNLKKNALRKIESLCHVENRPSTLREKRI